MKFGAHETMETHEMLMEKINAIAHFNLYAREAKNPQLRDMIMRHTQDAMASYNEIVGLTRGNSSMGQMGMNTDMMGSQIMGGQMMGANQQIQYGLRNPPSMTPQSDATMSDQEIATALLICHKNGARNAIHAALECADANLRRAMMNSAMACTNHAYEVFLFMNDQGMYQVPTMLGKTTDTFLHSYQPAGAGMQGQYVMQAGQHGGYSSQGGYGMGMAQGGMGHGGMAQGGIAQGGMHTDASSMPYGTGSSTHGGGMQGTTTRGNMHM